MWPWHAWVQCPNMLTIPTSRRQASSSRPYGTGMHVPPQACPRRHRRERTRSASVAIPRICVPTDCWCLGGYPVHLCADGLLVTTVGAPAPRQSSSKEH